MKAAPFVYHRPDTLAEALALLFEHGDDAKVLAGGQSLLPLMALRLGRPAHLVDISRVPGLDRLEVAGDGSVSIGAMVRHAVLERDARLATSAPLLHETMPWIAHRAIRTRGTSVGSIAHGDPAAELPAVALATAATMRLLSTQGERTVAAADFFEGYLQTALRSDELLAEVTFPAWPADAACSLTEITRRHGDYALVGLAAVLRVEHGTVVDAALAYFGAASTPVRVPEAEQALIGRPPSEEAGAEAAGIAAGALNPTGDLHGSAAYRKHLVGVVTRRGLAAAGAKIGASV